MYKFFAPLFLLFMMSACLHQTPQVEATEQGVKSNKKVYEYEDSYILFALRAEQLRDFQSASDIFSLLYDNTGKKEYLYRSLQNDLIVPEFNKAITRVNALNNVGISDFVLMRVKIVALMGVGHLVEAKFLAHELLEESEEVDDYLLLSDIHVQLREYENALAVLERAYAKNYSEKVIDTMSLVLYVHLHKTQEAITRLESHSRMHGCSLQICMRLAGFYSKENDLEALLDVYLRIYELEQDANIAKKIVQIYLYKRDSLSLISFLENSKSDDDTLLQLYANMKNYDKAHLVAKSLYKKTGDVSYLGRSAIYKYESYADKTDRIMLTQVIENLKSVLELNNDALYLNYLGYILIDHDVNIKEGMKYIEKALEKEPNSSYYLDSLAWGHYKLGECKEASEIMKKVLTLEGGDNVEVLLHIKAIEECLKMKKVGKK
jgi:tetratricopeptide (TPR) repeat protein